MLGLVSLVAQKDDAKMKKSKKTLKATDKTVGGSKRKPERKNPYIPSMIDIGKRIVEARNQQGMTQATLALKMKTSAQDVGQIENGWRAVSVPRLHAFAHALRVEPDWLLTGIDPYLATTVRRLMLKSRAGGKVAKAAEIVKAASKRSGRNKTA